MEGMFKKATRMKLRFETTKGSITVEDLWDMPLLNDFDGFCLNDAAKTVSRKLKEYQEENFVEDKSVGNKELELKLDILKVVIADKKKEIADAKNAVERKAKKDKLMAVLERKQDAELEDLSPDAIRDMINEL